MTASRQSDSKPSRARIWREAGGLWLALLVLFAVNVLLAYVQLGAANVAVHMSIASMMIVLLVFFFMDFKSYTPQLRLAAVSGLFWLVFMFALTAADYFTRP